MKPIYFEKSLGIDIREESVAIALLGKKLRKTDLLGFHFFSAKPLKKEDEEPERLFLEEIDRFLRQYECLPCGVTVSLPRSAVSFQTFELPAPDRNVIDSMIEFEVEKHFFCKPEEIYFSYHAAEKSENLFHIVLSAIKKEVADYYLQLLERLSLKISTLSVSTLSNLNLIASDSQQIPPVTALVDVSAGALDVNIVKEGRLQISRNVPIKNREVADFYFMDDASAERCENLAGELSGKIIEEILAALSSCAQIGGDEAIERIFLIGGGNYAEFLAKQIEEKSGTPAAQVCPPCKATPGLSAEFNPAFLTTAVGLALRELKPAQTEINLLPKETRPKKKRINVKSAFALSVAALLLLIGLLVSKIVSNTTTLSALETRLQEVKRQVGPLERVDQEYENLKQYADILAAIGKVSPQKLPALEELTKMLPQDTWLTEISIKKEQVEIRGVSASASALIPLLEKATYFKDAGFNGAVTKTPDGERFAIRLILKGKE